jgi:hypothetical protein
MRDQGRIKGMSSANGDRIGNFFPKSGLTSKLILPSPPGLNFMHNIYSYVTHRNYR